MKISRQGYTHYSDGINNQDFYYTEGNMKMILDGCSDSKYSEIGTRLFVQLFATLPNRTKLECFEENVKYVFDKLLEQFKFWYKSQEDLENFIMDNLLFTIVACFETENSFVVKLFGDGYVVTENHNDCVSYIKHYYGRRPTYYVYKYCELIPNNIFKEYEFKTFTFSKEDFKEVGIASDGIAPIVKYDSLKTFDDIITSKLKSDYTAEGVILSNIQSFGDDVKSRY